MKQNLDGVAVVMTAYLATEVTTKDVNWIIKMLEQENIIVRAGQCYCSELKAISTSLEEHHSTRIGMTV